MPSDSITLPIGEYYARLDTPAGPDPLANSDPLALPVPMPQPMSSGSLSQEPSPALGTVTSPDWAQWQPTLDLPTRHGLRELQQRIQQDDHDKWDLTVPRDRLALAQGQLVLPEEHLDEHPELLTLSPWATAQACQRLGIPAPYFVRCSAPLQDAQFNHWAWRTGADLDDDTDGRAGTPRPWLLRCQGEGVRAVLSDRYAPLDNADLLGTLVPLLEDRFEVRGLSLTPESLHLRLVDPRLCREVLPNDRLMVGVHVANSEVGRRSVTVDALVWRLVCLNGMVRLVRGKSLLRQRHISWDRPRFAEALRMAVSEAVTAGAGLIDRLQTATREPVPDVEGVVRAIARQAALTRSVQERILQALSATAPPQQERVYGLVQALTFTAQSLPPDDRYDLEVVAGRLLDEGLPAPVREDALPPRLGGSKRILGRLGNSGGSAHAPFS